MRKIWRIRCPCSESLTFSLLKHLPLASSKQLQSFAILCIYQNHLPGQETTITSTNFQRHSTLSCSYPFHRPALRRVFLRYSWHAIAIYPGLFGPRWDPHEPSEALFWDSRLLSQTISPSLLRGPSNVLSAAGSFQPQFCGFCEGRRPRPELLLSRQNLPRLLLFYLLIHLLQCCLH